MEIENKIKKIQDELNADLNKDPDIRQFIEISIEVGELRRSTDNDPKKIDKIIEDFKELAKEVTKRATSPKHGIRAMGISTLISLIDYAKDGISLDSEEEKELLKTLGGVGSYVYQRRVTEKRYQHENFHEISQIKDLANASPYLLIRNKFIFDLMKDINSRVSYKLTAQYSNDYCNIAGRIQRITNYLMNNEGVDTNLREFSETTQSFYEFLLKEIPEIFYEETDLDFSKNKYSIYTNLGINYTNLTSLVQSRLVSKRHGIRVSHISPLYNMSELIVEKSLYKNNDEKELINMLAGISFFITQEKVKNPDYIFDNENEMNRISELLELCPELASNITIQEIAEEIRNNIVKESVITKTDK